MTYKERRSIERHQRQAQKYQRLAEAHEQMIKVIEEDIDDWLFLEDIPKGQPIAWYREQAELYRAKVEQEQALAALEEEVAMATRFAQMPPDVREIMRDHEREHLQHMIRCYEELIADMQAKLRLLDQI